MTKAKFADEFEEETGHEFWGIDNDAPAGYARLWYSHRNPQGMTWKYFHSRGGRYTQANLRAAIDSVKARRSPDANRL